LKGALGYSGGARLFEDCPLRHISLLLGAGALLSTASVAAQHQHMPGMTMPMPEKKAAKPKKKAAGKASPTEKAAAAKKPADKPAQQPKPMDHSQMDHAQMGQMPMEDMAPGGHAEHAMAMTGALGSYPMTRESSGTAWQPDSSEHDALHVMSGDWTLMAHGVLNLVADHQSGGAATTRPSLRGCLWAWRSDRSATVRCNSEPCSAPIR